ncbi:mediator complex subunit MED14-domain-containing protein [Vararia minispora EC-137]|uniref:Mediator complex subunit MED14-domain-containing protein n=1 Tax=Vararia minispora EC-137 TaxID=1314806 RepID=A0ACB8QHT2_9AGAM|nr:mediator complex subunit MED14-domain-containing protein [Vararia minispora EC-137]
MFSATTNGTHHHILNGYLENELPIVEDGLMPLSEVVSRVVQACYADLSDLAETCREMARKQQIARFCQRWKKQMTKLYAVVKWSREAHIVQKCMNITAFLLGQNQQFEDVKSVRGGTVCSPFIRCVRILLNTNRVRNHDLLTSLDVLTTGTYQRLPTDIRKRVFPPKSLSDEEVGRTLTRIEAAIRYRLRMHEIVPVEMSSYRVEDGRAFFTVPGLFEASVCLLGMEKTDSWFFTGVEFLFNIGGELIRPDELPKKPSGHMLQWISDEADTRLGFYSTEQAAPVSLIPGQAPPRKPQLEEGTVDTPLVRLFNFLQMMSMSYQLEILWSQAERLRFLGWGEYLSVRMSEDRHTLTLSYWLRRTPPPSQPASRVPTKIPLHGGTVTISLVSSPEPQRKPQARVLAELQARARLAGRQPSDSIEALRWEVRWEPQPGAIGFRLAPQDTTLRPEELQIVGLLNAADGNMSLRAMLCADEVVFTAIDARTGRVKLWDTGDLGAAGRGSRFTALTEKVNENPGGFLLRVLVQLRLNTIIDLAQQKAHYLGLQTYKMRNFHGTYLIRQQRVDLTKFGRSARGQLYIQLAPYPSHYLVLVVTDDDFRYALISATPDPGSMYGHLVMNDIGWLDVSRICTRPVEESVGPGKRKREEMGSSADSKFRLETNVLRELYAYCCARVAHMNVEKQFKQHSIPYTHVFPSAGLASSMPTSIPQVHSALSTNIPSLCVQSTDIIKEDKALDAAMPNIRVIPLAWWHQRNADGSPQPQVVTCVKLRYVQQPVGRRAGSGIIRPSKRIVYDADEGIVCFLADEVEGCVELFMKEWNSVSKIVAIAREVAQMTKRWKDTVEFVYAADFVLSVACDDPTNPSAGSFHLHFSRLPPSTPPATAMSSTMTSSEPASLTRRPYNPHSDAEPFFLHLLRNNPLSCLPRLVDVLRNTVPIVAVLEEIRTGAEDADEPPGWSAAAVDTFPKAAGWWRATFGPGARHALDFRLLSGPRIALLDASHALTNAPQDTMTALLLKPIPRMREIVGRAAKEAKRGFDPRLSREKSDTVYDHEFEHDHQFEQSFLTFILLLLLLQKVHTSNLIIDVIVPKKFGVAKCHGSRGRGKFVTRCWGRQDSSLSSGTLLLH